MTRKHHAIYSDPTGAAAAAAPVKRRSTRTKTSESISETSSMDSMRTARTEPTVDREAVARLAYSYWAARGFVGGSAEEDWLRAEEEIRSGQGVVA